MNKGEKAFTYCTKCLKNTEHECISKELQYRTEELEHAVLDHTVTVNVLQCKTCFSHQLRVSTYTEPPEWSSEKFVPPHPDRSLPHWIGALPEEAQDLLREVYVALADRKLWLVGIGTRTLIDMFILARVGDQGGFKDGLNRLKSEGYMGEREIGVLKQALELGNAATHRLRKPSLPDCIAALEITEGLLHRLTLAESATHLSAALAGSKRPTRKAKGHARPPPPSGSA